MKKNVTKWFAALMAAAMIATSPSIGTFPTLATNVYADAEATITITDQDISSSLTIPDQEPNGVNPPELEDNNEVLPTITLKNGTKLTKGTDYTVSTDAVEAGNQKFTITFTGKYSGTISASFVITGEHVKGYSLFLDDASAFEYDGTAIDESKIKAAYDVLEDGSDLSDAKWTASVTPVDSTKADGDAGEKYTVEIKSADGTKTLMDAFTVTIAQKDISELSVTATPKTTYTYNGQEQTVEFSDVAYDQKTIDAEDYTVTENKATDAGDYKATITPVDSNYTGTATVGYTIEKYDLSKATVNSDAADVDYTGEEQTVKISGVYMDSKAGATEIPSSDYTVTYEDNTNAGTAHYYVTANEDSKNFTGKKDNTFKIKKVDLSGVTVTENSDASFTSGVTYDDAALKKMFTVKLDDVTVDTDDYTYTSKEAKRGDNTFTLTAADSGNFIKDSTTKTPVVEADAKKFADGGYSSSYTDDYTGDEIEPDEDDIVAGTGLDESDFEITGYENNTDAGKATDENAPTAIIKGHNEYEGYTSKITFTINPIEIKNLSYRSRGQKKTAYLNVTLSEKDHRYALGEDITADVTKLEMPTEYVNSNKGQSGSVTYTEIPAGGYKVVVAAIDSGKVTEVTIEGVGNYSGSVTTTSVTNNSVDSVDLRVATYEAEIPKGLTSYTADIIKSYVKVTSSDGKVIPADDYTLTVDQYDEENATIQFTVSAADNKNIENSKQSQFSLVTRDISDLKDQFSIEDADSQVYSGKALTPEVNYADTTNVNTLKLKEDYTVEYSDNTNAGTATVTISGLGNYKGSITKTFEIKKYTLTTDDFVVNLPDASDYIYDPQVAEAGKTKDLSDKITVSTAKDKDYVIPASAYTVSLSDNSQNKVNAGDVVDYTITFADADNYNDATYNGDKTGAEYTISALNVTNEMAEITLKNDTVVVDNEDETDAAREAEVASVKIDNVTLDAKTAYDVSYVGLSTDEPQVKITFKGNYSGFVTKSYTITTAQDEKKSAKLNNVQITGKTVTYTGNSFDLSDLVAVYAPAKSSVSDYTLKFTDADGKELDSYSDIVNAGTYTATIVGTGSYKGYTGASAQITVNKKTLSKKDWATIALEYPYWDYDDVSEMTLEASGQSWFDSDDYVITDEKNYNEEDGTGVIKVTVNPKSTNIAAEDAKNSQYYTEITFYGDIVDWLDEDHMDKYFTIDPQTYTGSDIEPEVKTIDGMHVSADWVKVNTYDDNVFVGVKTAKAMLEVTVPEGNHYYHAGTYTGELTFTINKADLSDASISAIADQTYTGKAIEPELTVKKGDVKLTQDKDYKVTYTDNTEIGTATATVTGIGNYAGTATAQFNIKQIDLSDASISAIADQTYTGKAIEPAVTVKKGDVELEKDKDYTVSYSNNTKTGTATVTVTGIGNYAGTATKTFTIKAAAVTKKATVIKVAHKTKSVKKSTLKSKRTLFSIGAKANSGATVSYKKISGCGYITVTSKGAVVINPKAKLKNHKLVKGTHRLKVRLTAPAKGNYTKKVVDVVLAVTLK